MNRCHFKGRDEMELIIKNQKEKEARTDFVLMKYCDGLPDVLAEKMLIGKYGEKLANKVIRDLKEWKK